MSKAARIRITNEVLEMLLGLDLGQLHILHAQVDHSRYGRCVLEVIVVGEGLSDTFTVNDGDVVKDADIIVHNKQTTSEIVPK